MGTMTIGKAAKEAGLSIDTVRFWEREGLLDRVHRTASGYRMYSDEDVDRLRFIRRAKALGFNLPDIGELLQLAAGSGRRTDIRQLAQRRLADLERKLDELGAIRDALAALVKRCSGQGPVRGCPIIEGVLAHETRAREVAP
jgi:DNA-binding transcriptional MerR regulator